MNKKIVLISLTTISSRINKLQSVIESLVKQNTSVIYTIKLYISESPFMLDEGIKNIPIALKELVTKNKDKFEIIYTENIGSYRKYIPALESYYSGVLKFDYIVTVDDDTIYPDHWLEGLVSGIKDYNCVVAYRGRQMKLYNDSIAPYKSWIHSKDELSVPSILTVGTGKDGIIYSPDFFHHGVMNYAVAMELCSHADDLWLKLHTAILGVKTVLLETNLNKQFIDVSPDDKVTLYDTYNKKGGNDVAIEKLINFCISKYGLNLFDVLKLNVSANTSWKNDTYLKTLTEGI